MQEMLILKVGLVTSGATAILAYAYSPETKSVVALRDVALLTVSFTTHLTGIFQSAVNPSVETLFRPCDEIRQ